MLARSVRVVLFGQLDPVLLDLVDRPDMPAFVPFSTSRLPWRLELHHRTTKAGKLMQFFWSGP